MSKSSDKRKARRRRNRGRSDSIVVRPSIYRRSGLMVLSVAVLALPLVLWGGYHAMKTSNNNVRQWLPADIPQTREYDWRCEHFPSDESIFVSWEGCTPEDSRLAQLAHDLLPPPWERPKDHPPYFQDVTTGPEVLEQLTGKPFHLTRDESIERLQGTLFSLDGETTCLVLKLTEEGHEQREQAIEAVYHIAQASIGLTPEELHVAGEPVTNAVVDRESREAVRKWVALAWLAALALAAIGLRDFRLITMIFAVSLLCATSAVAIVQYTGGTMNLVLVVMPVLIGVLALSAGIHLVNYYRDAYSELEDASPAMHAVRMGWLPCALSAGTTAIGLGSLYVSEIIPVKHFGLYSAVGIILSVLIIFLVLPSALELWPANGARKKQQAGAHEPSAWDAFLLGVADWIIARRSVISVSCVLCMVFLGFGISLIETSVKPLKFFPRESKLIRDYVWLEDHFGALVPIEVIVCFGEECELSFLDRMELVDNIQREVETLENVGSSISAATFAPKLPGKDKNAKSGGLTSVLKGRDFLNRRLERNRQHFVEQRFIAHDGNEELWRVSARVEGLTDIFYDKFLVGVEEKVNPLLAAAGNSRGNDGIRAVYTGIDPLFFLAQRKLLEGLYESFLLAFVLIAAVMICLLRNVPAGLMTMIPNVFPAIVIFGGMGWLNWLGWFDTKVDIGSMMTASVALGIAVDDTLHFLTWFHRGLSSGLSRHEAIRSAYDRCARAMTQTTAIAGLGMLMMSLSSFMPVSRFGLLMCILLTAALVGDLIFLPAILAGPLGKVFEWKAKARAKQAPARRQEDPAPEPVA